ncbi:MAG: DUF697 domain-containing protein [Rhodospirillaceae bacterium]
MGFKNSLVEFAGGVDGLIARAADLVGVKIAVEGKGERETRALTVVRRYATLSFVSGCVPLPYIDLAMISTAQLAMLAEIAAVYEIPFHREKAKAVVSAVLGSLVPQGLAAGVAGSAVKAIPIVGQAAGMVLMPGFAATFAYALGKVFIDHFESGSTLLDLDPERLKTHFKAAFEAERGRASYTPPEGPTSPV